MIVWNWLVNDEGQSKAEWVVMFILIAFIGVGIIGLCPEIWPEGSAFILRLLERIFG